MFPKPHYQCPDRSTKTAVSHSQIILQTQHALSCRILSGLILMSKLNQGVFCFENCPNVVTILDTFVILKNAIHTANEHRAKRLILMFRVTSSRRAVKNWIDGATRFPSARNIAFLKTKRWSNLEVPLMYDLRTPQKRNYFHIGTSTKHIFSVFSMFYMK